MPDARSVTGSMIISGASLPYRLTMKHLENSGLKRFNASKWKLNTGKWLLDGTLELPQEVYCIVVAKDSVAKVLVCLCLVQLERDNQWRRVDLCH